METIKGYAVLSETIGSPELVWRTVEGEQTLPQVFESERAAQLEILDDLQSDIEQFRSGEREWDEIHWPDEYTVAQIEIAEDGSIVVYQQWDSLEVPDMVIKETIIETTLKSWRENL